MGRGPGAPRLSGLGRGAGCLLPRSRPQGRAPVRPRGAGRRSRSLYPRTGTLGSVGKKSGRDHARIKASRVDRDIECIKEVEKEKTRRQRGKRWKNREGGRERKEMEGKKWGSTGCKGVPGSCRSSSSYSGSGRCCHLRLSDPHTRLAASAPGLPPASPAARRPQPTGCRCTSWAPSRIPVAEPPVKRRARAVGSRGCGGGSAAESSRTCCPRGEVSAVRSDAQTLGRVTAPLHSRHSRPSRQAPGAGGCPLSLASPSPVSTPPPAWAGRKVAPKSWYLR